MKGTINLLLQSVMAIGLAIVAFLALTTGVQFWLITGSHVSATQDTVVMPYPTPDPETHAP